MSRALVNRVTALEGRGGTGPRRPTNVLFLDSNGPILWDGSDRMRGWAGQPSSAWPPEWLEQPRRITRLIGVDPLALLGINPGPASPDVIPRGEARWDSANA